MPRPIKSRRIEHFPKDTYFVPLGKRKCELEEITLKFEEVEAMRLKDIEGLNQEECAQKMEISRQTFQNIIDSARNKVAKALTKGYAINITGGYYTAKQCRFRCAQCGTQYEINYERDKRICPECGSDKVACGKEKKHCHKWCRVKSIPKD